MDVRKWYLRTQDETFGPETEETLVSWAKMGRIQPGQELSDDNVIWTRVEEMPFLDMRFSIDIGDGNPRGPFNRAAADALIASGRLPATARVVETRAPFPVADHPSETAVEPPEAATDSGRTDPPAVEPDGHPQEQQFDFDAPPSEADAPSVSAEDVKPAADEPEVKILEKIVEVPVEKIIEKEVRIEVPVEKIVEKVVTVVDETRVKELEALLAEERSRAASLQQRYDESSRAASEQRNEIARLEGEIKNGAEREKALEARVSEATAKFVKAAGEAADREKKLTEQMTALEDELRRLPQAASEVASIQAAMYGIMTKEAEEIETLLAVEKAEADEFRKRSEARFDRLLERRRVLLKRAGTNIEDMTRKALVDRPEDPRTVHLRRELEELRRQDEKKILDAQVRIRDLEASVADHEAAARRAATGLKDVAELRRENAELRERLKTCEHELLVERESAESARQRETLNRQAMVARLKSLESPNLGITVSDSSVQSHEAKLVRLPGWMSIGSSRK